MDAPGYGLHTSPLGSLQHKLWALVGGPTECGEDLFETIRDHLEADEAQVRELAEQIATLTKEREEARGLAEERSIETGQLRARVDELESLKCGECGCDPECRSKALAEGTSSSSLPPALLAEVAKMLPPPCNCGDPICQEQQRLAQPLRSALSALAVRPPR